VIRIGEGPQNVNGQRLYYDREELHCSISRNVIVVTTVTVKLKGRVAKSHAMRRVSHEMSDRAHKDGRYHQIRRGGLKLAWALPLISHAGCNFQDQT